MDKAISEKLKELWNICQPIDLFTEFEKLEADINKMSDMVQPCRMWLSKRNKLKNIKRQEDSYSLKHIAEHDIGKWVPHSVFIFAAYLEGFQLSSPALRDGVYVVSMNLGAIKKP